jgi:hypothetical protein
MVKGIRCIKDVKIILKNSWEAVKLSILISHTHT